MEKIIGVTEQENENMGFLAKVKKATKEHGKTILACAGVVTAGVVGYLAGKNSVKEFSEAVTDIIPVEEIVES